MWLILKSIQYAPLNLYSIRNCLFVTKTTLQTVLRLWYCTFFCCCCFSCPQEWIKTYVKRNDDYYSRKQTKTEGDSFFCAHKQNKTQEYAFECWGKCVLFTYTYTQIHLLLKVGKHKIWNFMVTRRQSYGQTHSLLCLLSLGVAGFQGPSNHF